MKKKIISLCLVLALALTAIGGATLAYFTDKDQVNNTFSIGNIDIDLYEKTDEYGDKEFQNNLDYSNIMPGDVLSKEPYIRNESGVNAAYVRVFVQINNAEARNTAIDVAYENLGQAEVQNKYNAIFSGWGINNTKVYDKITGYNNVIRNSMAQRTVTDDGVILYNIDSVRCPYATAGYQWEDWNKFQTAAEKSNSSNNMAFGGDGYYKNALNKDSNLYVFYLKLDAGKQYKLFDGLNVPAEFNETQMKMFDGLKIDIYADAIQVDNFKNETEAFEALEAAHPMGWWNA